MILHEEQADEGRALLKGLERMGFVYLLVGLEVHNLSPFGKALFYPAYTRDESSHCPRRALLKGLGESSSFLLLSSLELSDTKVYEP